MTLRPCRPVVDGRASSGPPTAPRRPGHDAGTDERDEVDVGDDPRLEAHGGAGRDVEAMAVCRRPIEGERRVGLGEVVVRADLDGTVARVLDPHRQHRTAGVDLDRVVGPGDLAGDHACAGHGIGSCERDELGAVGERRLDLDLGEHLGHTFHHVVAAEHVTPGLHQVGHAATVARRFEHPVGQHRHRLRIVEPQPPCPPPWATSAATCTSNRSCS